MKRSEMLMVIQDSFDIINEDAAELILQAIEKAGMAPPERYRRHDWHERGITYSQWIQEPSKVREWEE